MHPKSRSFLFLFSSSCFFFSCSDDINLTRSLLDRSQRSAERKQSPAITRPEVLGSVFLEAVPIKMYHNFIISRSRMHFPATKGLVVSKSSITTLGACSIVELPRWKRALARNFKLYYRTKCGVNISRTENNRNSVRCVRERGLIRVEHANVEGRQPRSIFSKFGVNVREG